MPLSVSVLRRFLTGLRVLLAAGFFSFTLQAYEVSPPVDGKSFSVAGEITRRHVPAGVTVENAANPKIYADEVCGSSFTATVEDLPEGTYTIEIDLAELDTHKPGENVMQITSGDKVLADHLDLVQAAGFGKPYQVTGKVQHTDDKIGGPLSITFKALQGNAKFNAIRVTDGKGKLVAFVKAAGLTDAADNAAKAIPQVATPEIYTDPSKPMDARIDDLISRMSLNEKAAQIVNGAPAIPRLNLPAYNYWSESLHGVGRNGHATVFPQVIGLGATWDPPLIYQIGRAIADEARAKYYQALKEGEAGKGNRGLNFWAPNINIFRDPRWGRGQETYGEDPYLTSRFAVSYITGLQQTKDGVLEAMGCAKHFAVHSGPEADRAGFNVNPTTRDLYETYLPQFQAAVQEGHVGAVMAAYNSIYNVPCAADSWLLTDLLRTTWGFQGHIVSDCGAVSNVYKTHHYAPSREAAAAAALNAGLDLECGGNFRNLPKMVASGATTEKAIDTALHRVLEVRFRLGLFDPPEKDPFARIPASDVESPAHLALALQAARESIVLLKNNGILPLDPTRVKHIAVLGANADVSLNGNYSGIPSHSVHILDAIKTAAGTQVQVDYAQGCDLAGTPKKGSKDYVSPEDYQKAVAMAAAADVIIYAGGLNATRLEAEENNYQNPGFYHGDRTQIELPDEQEQLLRALQATGKPVIFINCSGSAIAMPWEAANLAAIVQAWYPGEGGTAVADVLFGKYNPSGRLPVTFYESTGQLPDFSDYRMANRTYRYFQGKPLFAFGFGLSYTTFQYSPVQAPAGALKRQDTVHLNVPIQNTGSRDGDEVVQVYLKHLASPVPQPIRSLIAFQRVAVKAGATQKIGFDIPVERFHYWDVEKKAYVVDPGSYELEIGAASSDIRQTCRIEVAGS